MKKIVCLSDTHGFHDSVVVPNGDILIHCGDFSKHGELVDTIQFLKWYENHPHQFKYLIAGNHDWLPYREPKLFQELLVEHAPSVRYLEDDYCDDSGLIIYGSPWTPEYHGWAFMKNEQQMQGIRESMPEYADIVAVHGPPRGVLDKVIRGFERVGCRFLWRQLTKIRPKLVLFGHIHEGRGHITKEGIDFYNCSVVGLYYKVEYEPYVIEMKEEKDE